jgi:hypothetical protein
MYIYIYICINKYRTWVLNSAGLSISGTPLCTYIYIMINLGSNCISMHKFGNKCYDWYINIPLYEYFYKYIVFAEETQWFKYNIYIYIRIFTCERKLSMPFSCWLQCNLVALISIWNRSIRSRRTISICIHEC